jgi:GntR family transcriptional repressor for pyruvate dehydrogenase complex
MDSKREATTNNLLAMVKDGRFSEGDQLPPERELALQLNVSRNLLREAIITLEALGILEVRKRQGIFVKEPSIPDFAGSLRHMPFSPEELIPQLMEARLLIEGHAAELAAKRRTAPELVKLEECFNRLTTAPCSTDSEKKSHAHTEFLFHSLIMQASHNTVLARIFEGLSSLMERANEILHLRLVDKEGWLDHVYTQHRTVLDAIKGGDGQVAGEAMRQHIQDSLSHLNNS